MSTTVNGVTVRLGRDDEDFRKFAITVQVASRRKPGLKSSAKIDPATASDAKALFHQVGIAGAAGAEYLGERYRDNIDPAVAARDAIRALGEEVHLMKELAANVPAKLKRLEQNLWALKDNQRELLARCRHIVNKGDNLTPQEVKALDQMIGQVHGGQL